MSLANIFDIAGSGLSAQALRLNITASNIANAESVSSSVNQTYRARHPVFASLMDSFRFDSGQPSAGVQVLGVVESQAPLRKEYQPDHSQSDDDGYIYLPNVNMVEEMANLISASRSYQSNVEAINASKQMLLQTLTLGQ
jgi:flagellar basal-body rod protein FlgC